jgi:hypothetical protein
MVGFILTGWVKDQVSITLISNILYIWDLFKIGPICQSFYDFDIAQHKSKYYEFHPTLI